MRIEKILITLSLATKNLFRPDSILKAQCIGAYFEFDFACPPQADLLFVACFF